MKAMSRWAVLVVILLGTSGCADGLDPAGPDALPLTTTVQSVGAPPGLPLEYYTAPWITHLDTDVSFVADRVTGKASMRFWANRAEQTIQMIVTNQTNGSTITVPEAKSRRNRVTPPLPPFTYTLDTNTQYSGLNACDGYSANAYSQHRAWHEALVPDPSGLVRWHSWGLVEAATNDGATRPPSGGGGGVQSTESGFSEFDDQLAIQTKGPIECTEPNPGGGGGDNSPECFTIITDHYWYYPDTGKLEYRYTTYDSYCME